MPLSPLSAEVPTIRVAVQDFQTAAQLSLPGCTIEPNHRFNSRRL